jgi:hypothetical protein
VGADEKAGVFMLVLTGRSASGEGEADIGRCGWEGADWKKLRRVDMRVKIV